ncbi:MAG TPA: hypothetical protein VFR84_11030 [Candidatus Angelobacter sp.]|nr:hypothetical protein [Candidatus Angelobacter sp.]
MPKSALFCSLVLAISVLTAAQANPNQDVFTINVTSPRLLQDVQVRYFLSGNPAVQQAGSVARPNNNHIVIDTAVSGTSAKGFRAIVFAPGCQLATIKADLAAGTRQADFQCQKLGTTPLHGKADVSRFAGKALEVSALYNVRWAGQFFGVPRLAVSPLAVGKAAKVEPDGSFTLDLPDFASDPLWNSLSHNATLTLVLLDAATGVPVAQLDAPRELAVGSSLKVAASYPAEIEFALK